MRQLSIIAVIAGPWTVACGDPVHEQTTDVGTVTPTDAIRTTDEVQYLAFSVDVPHLFEPNINASSAHSIIDAAIANLVTKVGERGDGQTRKLAFNFVLSPWMLDRALPGVLQMVIAQAFQVASEREVAFHITIETHYFWSTRSDLYNFFDPNAHGYSPDNAENVEWVNWKGDPYRWRFVDWGAPEMLAAPHMCYGSSRVVAEVDRLAKLIGDAIVTAITGLDENAVFSGVTVGSEPSLDNYAQVDTFDPALAAYMGKVGAPKARLGYCALSAAGYSETNLPTDFSKAAATANQTFIERWAAGVAAAGVSTQKLYTHIAASADGTSVVDFTNAPIWVAFIEHARPGWTTYPWAKLAADFSPITEALAAHGAQHWGDRIRSLRAHASSAIRLPTKALRRGRHGGRDEHRRDGHALE